MHLNQHKVGLTLGGLAGLGHLVWALFVVLGWARPLADFILGLHFFQVSYSIAPFSLGSAVLLVIVTSVMGYIVGFIFATLWNRLHKA